MSDAKFMVSTSVPLSLVGQLTFSRDFNQPIVGVTWPDALEQLTFCRKFNLPFQDATRPTSMQQLTFGWTFNQPTAGAASMEELEFEGISNQPIEGGKLPTTLRQLKFGLRFNRSIVGVTMATSLQQLREGWHFNQSLEAVALPPSVLQLDVGLRSTSSRSKRSRVQRRCASSLWGAPISNQSKASNGPRLGRIFGLKASSTDRFKEMCSHHHFSSWSLGGASTRRSMLSCGRRCFHTRSDRLSRVGYGQTEGHRYLAPLPHLSCNNSNPAWP